MPGGDATQSGYFDWAGPAEPNIEWTQKRSPYLIPVKETQDGTLYCSTMAGLAAVDPHGEILWTYDSVRMKHDTLTVDSLGMVRYLDEDDQLHTLNQDGELQSIVDCPHSVFKIAYDSQGRSYTVSTDNEAFFGLIALDHEGRVRWRVGEDAATYVRFDVVADLVFTYVESRLAVYDLDGNEAWGIDLPTSHRLDIFLTADGHSYVSGRSDYPDYTFEMSYYDKVGNLLSTAYPETMEYSVLFGTNRCGSDNELFYFQNGEIRRIWPDGQTDVFAQDVASFEGVTESGAVHYMTGEPENLTYHWHSRSGSGTCSGNELAWGQSYLGRNLRVFTRDVRNILKAYTLGGDAEPDWVHVPSRNPDELTVDTNGNFLVADDYVLDSFTKDGSIIWSEYYPSGDEVYSADYLGYWDKAGAYLVRENEKVLCWHPESGVVWERSCERYDRVSCVTSGSVVYLSISANLWAIDHLCNEVFHISNLDLGNFFGLAVGRDGTIYSADYGGNIQAISGIGEILWQLELEDQSGIAVTVASNNLILAHGGDSLFGISTDGKIRWKYGIDGRVFKSRPAVSPGGLIFLPTGPPTRPEAAPQIQTPSHHEAQTNSPTTGGSVVVPIDPADYELLILTTSGTLKHTLTDLGVVTKQPIIDSNGTAYVCNLADELIALLPNGQTKWRKDLSEYSATSSTPVVAPDLGGGLIVANRDYVISIGN